MNNIKTPIFETARLILREPNMNDSQDYINLMMSQRTKYMGGPFSLHHAWGIFCRSVALWKLVGHGGLMIDNRETGQCLGQVMINDGPYIPETELIFLTYEFAEGNGYASEAASAMIQWAFNVRQLKSLVSYIHKENHRSQSFVERLGAQQDNTAPSPDPSYLVFRYRPT